MRPNETGEDPVLAALRELRPCDVSAARARRLRSRCHRGLERQHAVKRAPRSGSADVWRRSVRVFAGAWCVIYLLETIRRAAAVYGF
jgi:hypothetical protein